MINILVTGGAGFIGSNFISYMLNKYPEYNIINYDIMSYAAQQSESSHYANNPNYHFVQGDVQNEELLSYVFKKYNITGVVHFAAESHVDNSIKHPSKFINSNVNGTFTVTKLCNEYKARMLFISTDEVYGTLEIGQEPFKETNQLCPNNPYSSTKAAGQQLVRGFNITYGTNTVIVNCANNFGPRQFPEKLIPKVISCICNKTDIPIYGTGDNIREWIYVEDTCNAIDLVLHEANAGTHYNIGSGCEITNNELVNMICYLMDIHYTGPYSYASLITHVEDRKSHDFRYAVNYEKIRDEIGFIPTTNIIVDLTKTIHWYMETMYLT